jgi:hypothetical protein
MQLCIFQERRQGMANMSAGVTAQSATNPKKTLQ